MHCDFRDAINAVFFGDVSRESNLFLLQSGLMQGAGVPVGILHVLVPGVAITRPQAAPAKDGCGSMLYIKVCENHPLVN